MPIPTEEAKQFSKKIRGILNGAMMESMLLDAIAPIITERDAFKAGLDRLYNAVKTEDMADDFDPALGEEVAAALDVADALLNPKEDEDGD